MEDEDRQEILAVVHDFARVRLRPLAASVEDEHAAPDHVLAELHGMGLLPAVPEAYGGQGAIDPGIHLRILSELAAGDPATTWEASASGAAVHVIDRAASRDQRERLLPAFGSDASRTGTVAYHEGFGRSPLELETTASLHGDRWVLTGAKRTVVRAGAVDIVVVVARLKSGGLAAFVLPEAHEGLTIRDDGATSDKLGLRGARTGSLDLHDVAVGPDALLGEPDSLELHRAVAWVRLVPAAMTLGLARAAVEYAVDYAMIREAFGRRIIDYQGVEFPLTEADMALDVAELSVSATWDDVEQSTERSHIAEAVGSAVHVACTASVDATRTAVNVLGGHGYLTDHPVERWYRDATTLSALDFDPLVVGASHPGRFAGQPIGLSVRMPR